MSYDFKQIFAKFNVNGEFVSCEPYGEGHINQTFLLITNECGEQKKYILQRINSQLFTDVPRLMQNIKSVTEFVRARVCEAGGDPDRESLTVIDAKDGLPYVMHEGNYFRVYVFIDKATAHQIVTKPEHFYQSAVAFGNFANLLAKFDASTLFEPLPNFHNTVKRFKDLQAAISENRANRLESVKNEVEFALAREELTHKIVDKLASGEIPLKVTHNDTKLNNVLIDDASEKAVAVIDLDTIMPGSILYDFGDSIRFGCSTALEDEPDLSKVHFDIKLFEVYVNGYIGALRESMTKAEADNLALGAILMTYECGIRFLTDHLNGDTYFRIKRENHNLDRTRTQFRLVEEMEAQLGEMNAIVAKYYNK